MTPVASKDGYENEFEYEYEHGDRGYGRGGSSVSVRSSFAPVVLLTASSPVTEALQWVPPLAVTNVH